MLSRTISQHCCQLVTVRPGASPFFVLFFLVLSHSASYIRGSFRRVVRSPSAPRLVHAIAVLTLVAAALAPAAAPARAGISVGLTPASQTVTPGTDFDVFIVQRQP